MNTFLNIQVLDLICLFWLILFLLLTGDLILAVNELSFRNVCFKDAVRVLRQAVSPLKLLILRENPQKLFTTTPGRCDLYTQNT